MMFKYLNLLSIFFLLISNLNAIERIQEISLKKGWNAIYLEVNPLIKKQNLSLFMMPLDENNKSTSTPISMITTYYPKTSSIEYISNPNNIGWKKASWNRWIRDDLPEAFLSNLYDLEANHSYLIKVDKDFLWKVKGKVEHITRIWQPNSFNLVGFNVSNPPLSFHQYFQNNSSAKTLENKHIYTLKEGKWIKINPIDEAIESNKAYWVYSDGSSSFQGVLDITVGRGSSEISFLDILDNQTISLKNTSTDPITVSISLENNKLPLSLVGKDSLQNRTYTPVSNLVQTLTLKANAKEEITLAIRRNEMNGNDKKEGLLKFSVTESSEVFYIGISAYGGNL